MHDQREAQLQYEIESDNEAQALRLAELIKASHSGDTELPRAHALIGSMLEGVQAELQKTCDSKTRGMGAKYRSWLRALPLDVAALIAVRECIRMCGGPETHVHVQDLCTNVGKLWELEVRIRQAEAVNPVYMQKIHDQVKENATRNVGHLRRLYNVAVDRVMKGCIDLDLTRTEIMQIGKFGVDACYEAGLIEIQRGTNANGKMVSYVLAEEVEAFLTGYDKNDVRNIVHREETRMLCAPDEWTTIADGGYLSLRRKVAMPMLSIRRMRKSARAEVYEKFTAEKMPEVFSAVNYLQSIPFDLHPATRDAIVRVWQSGGNIMGVPSTQGPRKPEFPFPAEWVKEGASDEDLAIFGRWKRNVVQYYEEVKEWRGRVREVGAFLRSVRESQGPFWFPTYVDSRGRVYYRGVPNPQGSDLSKAVLHFHAKKPLGRDGLHWLKVHIANSSGFDKERMADRARWTEQNWEAIERALDAPEDYPEVWGTDAPWCMFAACWELREAYRSGRPEAYCTGIPVHMDATCSGLQHFSALLRDPVGATYVNLDDPMQCGPKQDIYARVASNALQMIELDTHSTDADTAALARWAIQVGIPRALAKKPVMTYVYGATLRGTTEHIEYLLEKEILPARGMVWLDTGQSYGHSMYIAKKLFNGIEAAVPAAAAAMRWLRTVTQQQPNGKRMTWHTPTGFWVQHDYQDYSDTRIKLNACGVLFTVVRDWTEGTRASSMQNAISPNFVHALDGSHLMMTANAMKRSNLQMVAIHDSFGTHPSDVGTMHRHIREQFVSLYNRPNLLTEFMWEVGGVGEVPPRGNFDLEEVLRSEFMFS